MLYKKLGELVNIKTGKLDANASDENGTYPFFTCAVENLWINTYAYDCECVLIAGNGDLNIKYYDGKFNAYQRTYVIESIDKSILDVKYLYYFMSKHVDILRRNSIGGVIKYIKLGDLTEPKIPVPPLETQKKIVEALDKAQALIDARKEQIRLMDELVKSVFVEMFGDLKYNNKNWKLAKFTEVASIDTKMVKDFDKYSNYPHIGIESIEKETGELKGYRSVKEDGVISGKYLFSSSHIIYSKIRPNLNKVALPDFEGVCSADAYPVLPKQGISNREFLGYTMRSQFFLNYILAFSSRTNLPKVNKIQVEGFEMPLPPIEVQNEFAKYVRLISNSKLEMQHSLEELEKNLEGLMHK